MLLREKAAPREGCSANTLLRERLLRKHAAQRARCSVLRCFRSLERVLDLRGIYQQNQLRGERGGGGGA